MYVCIEQIYEILIVREIIYDIPNILMKRLQSQTHHNSTEYI